MARNALRPGNCRAGFVWVVSRGRCPSGGHEIAFSSEVDAGSRKENASEQEILADDGLDLVDRVGLPVDRQQWRRLGEIHRTDRALQPGRSSDGLAVAVGCSSGQRIFAVRPLGAVVALAVPGKWLIVAGLDRVGVAEDRLPGAVGDSEIQAGVLGNAV